MFDAELQNALRPVLRATGNNVDLFRVEIERWFDDMMDRVSGWYKRKTQGVQLITALLLAVALDLDSVLLARVFWSDPTLRTAVATQAEAAARAPLPMQTGDPQTQFASIRTQVIALGLPVRGSCTPSRVGTTAPPWWCEELARSTRNLRLPLVGTVLPVPTDPVRWFGWLITAIAASLGAPFWFDVLKKFMSVRSSGRAPEETPTAPKTVPTPLAPGE